MASSDWFPRNIAAASKPSDSNTLRAAPKRIETPVNSNSTLDEKFSNTIKENILLENKQDKSIKINN